MKKAKTKRFRSIVKRRRMPGEIPTLRAAIRNHCLECMGWEQAEVPGCTAPMCWLWPFRMSGGVDTAWPEGINPTEGE